MKPAWLSVDSGPAFSTSPTGRRGGRRLIARSQLFAEQLARASKPNAAEPPTTSTAVADKRVTTAPGNGSNAQVPALVARAAQKNNIDPALLAGLIQTESGFNERAVSPAGAKGLTQLMDGTARGLGVTNPFDPEQSAMGGARLLRQLLTKYGGDVPLALAAYNAGSGAVDQHGGIPPYQETQTFIPRVLQATARYRQQTTGATN